MTSEDDFDISEPSDSVDLESLKKKNKADTSLGTRAQVVFDVLPEEAETNPDFLEKVVKTVVMDGVEWKNFEAMDLAFGVKKLRVSSIIANNVSMDEVEEKIKTAAKDKVQLVETVSMRNI
ncbi:hypothetical protein MHBO_000349 [Bonamia ostreae]|uniref:Translation elongation factor EF1B beta/delta subunit guanine nucleotide exchange domain-containing protein n=1 Tax=Bonamia ostreae TaxID=126728 RepID=A0ABV2AFB4_9EUKA